MTVDDAVKFCEEHELTLRANLRGYGFALYAEGTEPFPRYDWRTRDCFGGIVYTRRLGGYKGEPPEDALVV